MRKTNGQFSKGNKFSKGRKLGGKNKLGNRENAVLLLDTSVELLLDKVDTMSTYQLIKVIHVLSHLLPVDKVEAITDNKPLITHFDFDI